jgi:hypothetical protein
VKTDYLSRIPKAETDRKVHRIIAKALKDIKIKDLADASKRSLLNFYYRQYQTISLIRGQNLMVLLAILRLTDNGNEIAKNMPLSRAKRILQSNRTSLVYDFGENAVNIYGVPNQEFSEKYINERVKPIYDRLISQNPLDPDDITGHNTLRNRAEMEARYNGHLENVLDLKEQGNKLVIASSHADCSDRCSGWQGRVYSLDGTRGTTPDGRSYVPLEEATDVWYVTKAGKRYKNGLLGFNCRHYLVPYKDGYEFPAPTLAEEQRQYKITQKQRQMERNVRHWRTTAIYYKDTDRQMYSYARKKAIEHNKKYIAFSKENERAYYPSRTKIF